MIVYADVLILINTIVDYFILRAVEIFLHKKFGAWRILGASFIGGISSLYIFIPNSYFILEVLYKIFICFILAMILSGIIKTKKILLTAASIFLVTCGYTGVMISIWFLFKPYGLMINNSVVYFDISPLILVSFSVIFYILFSLLHYLFKSTSKYCERCRLEIFALDRKVSLIAILDNGNSIEDYFSDSEIIITDKKHICYVLGKDFEVNENLKNRFRKIPCGTVAGKDMLDAYRCDFAIAKTDKKEVRLNKPILAVSKINFNDDYSAIVNPRIFL